MQYVNKLNKQIKKNNLRHTHFFQGRERGTVQQRAYTKQPPFLNEDLRSNVAIN